MAADTGQPFTQLKVDGGMTANALLMQIQADLIELPVVRPSVIETSCFGAAWAAGVATGFLHRATLPDSLLGVDRQWRSEEHTSEFQSLMRISSAVFLLKKKR